MFYNIMKIRKVFIYAEVACWNRQLDATKIQNYLIKNDYQIVDNPDDADTIIFVSCAFLKEKLDDSLNKVKEFQKYGAELIVAGCLPITGKDELLRIFNGKTVGTKDLDKIENLLPPKNNVRFKDIEDANILLENEDEKDTIKVVKKIFGKTDLLKKISTNLTEHILKNLVGENSVEYKFSKKQFHIRIAWGCTGDCSYCTIKKSAGPFHSKPLEECIKEFKKGLSQGYKNFVLDATDVGAYGIDIESSFPELLDNITKIPGDYYIFIREVHPKWIIRYIDELENILKRRKILILDIAIQSANSRILKLMNRPSDIEKMKKTLVRLKKSIPDIAYTCEFIIGFPTETEEEFKQSINFIKEVGLTGGQIYLFSCRRGTEAEKIEPKIPEKEMIKRALCGMKFLKKAGYTADYISKEKLLLFNKKS